MMLYINYTSKKKVPYYILFYITVHPGGKCGMQHQMILSFHSQYNHLLKENSLR